MLGKRLRHKLLIRHRVSVLVKTKFMAMTQPVSYVLLHKAITPCHKFTGTTIKAGYVER